jgi:hypothetical protein
VASRLSSLNRFLRTVALWAITWGLSGVLLGLITITVQPDTGHVRRYEVPLLFGIPLGLYGLLAGSVFSVIGGSQKGRVRVILGCLAGGIAAILPEWFRWWGSTVLAVSIVVGTLLGGFLAKWSDNTPRSK